MTVKKRLKMMNLKYDTGPILIGFTTAQKLFKGYLTLLTGKMPKAIGRKVEMHLSALMRYGFVF
jgi:hypothetical protein